MDLISLRSKARVGFQLLFLSFLCLSPTQGKEIHGNGARSANDSCTPRMPWASDLQKLNKSSNAFKQLEFTKEFPSDKLRVTNKIYNTDFSNNCRIEFRTTGGHTPALRKGVSWKLEWAGANRYPGNPEYGSENQFCKPGPPLMADFCDSVLCTIPDGQSLGKSLIPQAICDRVRNSPGAAVARLSAGSMDLFVIYRGINNDPTGLTSCLRDLGAKITDIEPCKAK